jgi:hypothetical protein
MFAGIGTSATTLSSYPGSTSDSYGVQASNGNKYNNAAATAYTSAIAANDVIGMAFDATNGTLTYYKNGTSLGTAFTGIPSNTYFPMLGCDNNTIQINFGQQPFYYTPPTGYKALNTVNLFVPTILNGAQYMAATLWTGNGTSQSIVNSQSNGGNNVLGVTFQPDFVWYKGRSTIFNHALFDVTRGALQRLSSNLTSAETATAGSLTAFNSNGFSVGNDAGVNQNLDTYVGWQWKAGGTGVTNTSGSITSTVSASASSGFSVVTYTGTGANATVGHGLGVAPSMIIIKNRQAANSWVVYHVSTGNGNVMLLNTTNASTADSTAWNTTTPTSSVFSVGTGAAADTNQTSGGGQHVAYCFSAVAGYSAFGKYTGNGSADGPFVFTGFRPRFILFKNTTAYNWQILDTSRAPYNQGTVTLFPNLTDAENTTATQYDILSNGFKIRTSDAGSNGSGNTIIYAAFAENPFQIARAR